MNAVKSQVELRFRFKFVLLLMVAALDCGVPTAGAFSRFFSTKSPVLESRPPGSSVETPPAFLASAISKPHFLTMARTTKRTGLKRSSKKPEGTVAYRGIKILSIPGQPSATAQIFREALRKRSEKQRT